VKLLTTIERGLETAANKILQMLCSVNGVLGNAMLAATDYGLDHVSILCCKILPHCYKIYPAFALQLRMVHFRRF